MCSMPLTFKLIPPTKNLHQSRTSQFGLVPDGIIVPPDTSGLVVTTTPTKQRQTLEIQPIERFQAKWNSNFLHPRAPAPRMPQPFDSKATAGEAESAPADDWVTLLLFPGCANQEKP